MNDEIRIASGLVVNPGDRLIIGLQSAHLSRDDVVGLRLAVEDQLPGVQVTFVTGVGAMALLPADPPAGELRAAEDRIKVLEQELNENGAHFDAALQEYRRENEDLRKVTKERALARMQRDRLILAIRDHLDGKCGRTTRLLTDTVDLVEHEIGAAG